jgi:iron complex transport system substrate-binding protein
VPYHARSRFPRPGIHARWAGVLGASALFGAGLIGGIAGAATTTTTSGTSTANYPVTVNNCAISTTYASAPTRAVSNDINTTEDMLALGLGRNMLGTFGVNGDGPAGKPVPSIYQSAFKKVPDISSDYFTLEKLVGLHPDFVFAGWNYGFQTGTTLTPQNLANYGIKSLALTESCAHVVPGTDAVSIDDTYQDLTNLGDIFGVETKAAAVVAGMQAQVATAQSKVAGLAPVTVFDYDSGTSAPFTGPGLAMPTALIALGGGTNIFANLKQSWTSVSWEQVVAADPQCIIVNDYGTPNARQKIKFLETSSITKNITAVKNQCFLTLSYDQVTPSPRNGGAVLTIAKWLHPTAFGRNATGSSR